MSKLNYIQIESSNTVHEAVNQFLKEFKEWIYECMEEYKDCESTDVHDQGTYMSSWGPYINYCKDNKPLQFMKTQRNRIKEHFVRTSKWKHGYWKKQEVHHGTEHFELFLGSLFSLDIKDPKTINDIVDAAEHVGNWVPEIPIGIIGIKIYFIQCI